MTLVLRVWGRTRLAHPTITRATHLGLDTCFLFVSIRDSLANEYEMNQHETVYELP
jgi:hypothetical protein